MIPIHIPPLRERLEDIPMLLAHFLKQLKVEVVLKNDALDTLAAHNWPGNVRELKNLAERISVMHRGESICGHELQKLLNKKVRKPGNSGSCLPEDILDRTFNDARESFEKCYLEFHFLKNGSIISKTAEAIGIYSSNLHAKLRKYSITTSSQNNDAKEET